MSAAGPRERLGIFDAFADGLGLAATRNGLLFVVAFFIVEFLTLVLVFAGGFLYLPLDQVADAVGSGSSLPVGEDLSVFASVGAVLMASAFGFLVSTPVTIVAIRTFVVGAADRIPEDCLFYRLGRATVSAVLVTILVFVVTIAIFIGGPVGLFLALQYLPGGLVSIAVLIAGVIGVVLLYVAVWLHLLFVTHEIAVRDRGLVGALRGSWATVRGHRLRVFVLGAITVAIQGGAGGATAPAAGGEFGPVALGLLVVGLAVSAVFGVAATAVLARGYRQISPDDAVRTGQIGD